MLYVFFYLKLTGTPYPPYLKIKFEKTFGNFDPIPYPDLMFFAHIAYPTPLL